jgi:hypothetical protein
MPNITISATNDGGLADPAPLTYKASPPPLHDGDIVKVWPGSGPFANDAIKSAKLSDDTPQGDTLVGMQENQWWQFAQSFTAKGGRLHSAKFNLGPHAGATGNVCAHLYASTGVIGSTAMPTGAPLATSEIKDASTMGAGWIEFLFTGANAVDMVAGTVYCIAVDATPVTVAPIAIYYAAAGTHAGNMSGQLYGGNPWGAWPAGNDLPFQLYIEGAPKFKENVIGGYPAVRLAGLEGFNLTTPIPNAHPWTLIVVMKNAAALTLQALGWDAGGAAFLERNDGYETIMTPTNSFYIAPSAGLQSAFHVFVIQTDAAGAGTAYLWADGIAQAVVSWQGPYTNPFTQLCFGDGDMVEQLFCTGTLSTTIRQNVEKTLASKYGTPAPPAGSYIDLATLPNLQGWWKADAIGVPFTPAAIPGLLAWHKADDITLADGARLDVWPAAFGPNMTQPTAAYQPQFQTNRFNGLPGVHYDSGPAGAPVHMLMTPITIPPAWTIVAVMTREGQINSTGNNGNSNPTGGPRLYPGLPVLVLISTSQWGSTAAEKGGAIGVYTVDSSPACYTDGVGGPATSNVTAAQGGTVFNSMGSDVVGGQVSDGFILERLIYDHILTPTQRNQLETSLRKKWGVA